EERSPRELEPFVGVYLVNGVEWAVTLRGPSLFLEVGGSGRTRLKAQPDGAVIRADNDYTRMTFLVADGRATGVSIHQCVPTDHRRCRTLEGTKLR
ncbi:MAG: hypothetical protein AB7R55_24185, partial [Gemmatimonadales bacterium]